MDILACPIDKHHPLELCIFEEKDEIVEGLIVCPKCLRWYPIRDEIQKCCPTSCEKKPKICRFSRNGRKKFQNKFCMRVSHSILKVEYKRNLKFLTVASPLCLFLRILMPPQLFEVPLSHPSPLLVVSPYSKHNLQSVEVQVSRVLAKGVLAVWFLLRLQLSILV